MKHTVYVVQGEPSPRHLGMKIEIDDSLLDDTGTGQPVVLAGERSELWSALPDSVKMRAQGYSVESSTQHRPQPTDFKAKHVRLPGGQMFHVESYDANDRRPEAYTTLTFSTDVNPTNFLIRLRRFHVPSSGLFYGVGPANTARQQAGENPEMVGYRTVLRRVNEAGRPVRFLAADFDRGYYAWRAAQDYSRFDADVIETCKELWSDATAHFECSLHSVTKQQIEDLIEAFGTAQIKACTDQIVRAVETVRQADRSAGLEMTP